MNDNPCYIVPCCAGPTGKHDGKQILDQLEKAAQEAKWATAKHVATVDDVAGDKDGDDATCQQFPGVLLVARKETWREGDWPPEERGIPSN
jgi:hypothetical protein